jgi:hypothetical protein
MKVYLVKIGRKTRMGNFQELLSRAVAVSDDTYSNHVRNYFAPRYEGFDLQVDNIAVVELSEVITSNPDHPSAPIGEQGCIANFQIKYTETEKELYNEYKDLCYKANSALRELHNSIEERYKKLPYVFTYKAVIELETNVNYSGTFCKRLPIRSNDFFRVIKDCDDGTAELAITKNTEDSNDPGIPF